MHSSLIDESHEYECEKRIEECLVSFSLMSLFFVIDDNVEGFQRQAGDFEVGELALFYRFTDCGAQLIEDRAFELSLRIVLSSGIILKGLLRDVEIEISLYFLEELKLFL